MITGCAWRITHDHNGSPMITIIHEGSSWSLRITNDLAWSHKFWERIHILGWFRPQFAWSIWSWFGDQFEFRFEWGNRWKREGVWQTPFSSWFQVNLTTVAMWSYNFTSYARPLTSLITTHNKFNNSCQQLQNDMRLCRLCLTPTWLLLSQTLSLLLMPTALPILIPLIQRAPLQVALALSLMIPYYIPPLAMFFSQLLMVCMLSVT